MDLFPLEDYLDHELQEGDQLFAIPEIRGAGGGDDKSSAGPTAARERKIQNARELVRAIQRHLEGDERGAVLEAFRSAGGPLYVNEVNGAALERALTDQTDIRILQEEWTKAFGNRSPGEAEAVLARFLEIRQDSFTTVAVGAEDDREAAVRAALNLHARVEGREVVGCLRFVAENGRIAEEIRKQVQKAGWPRDRVAVEADKGLFTEDHRLKLPDLALPLSSSVRRRAMESPHWEIFARGFEGRPAGDYAERRAEPRRLDALLNLSAWMDRIKAAAQLIAGQA
jgi:hypothetical protein